MVVVVGGARSEHLGLVGPSRSRSSFGEVPSKMQRRKGCAPLQERARWDQRTLCCRSHRRSRSNHSQLADRVISITWRHPKRKHSPPKGLKAGENKGYGGGRETAGASRRLQGASHLCTCTSHDRAFSLHQLHPWCEKGRCEIYYQFTTAPCAT